MRTLRRAFLSPAAILTAVTLVIPLAIVLVYSFLTRGAYGGTLAEENLRLVCHGLLHLMGYDHQKAEESLEMKQLEDHYLDRLDS